MDLGCGDGRFAAGVARANPSRLVIGIEPDHASLVEQSRRAMRRRNVPDQSNVFFVLGAWQELPGPLRGIQADSIAVLFPWGSLLAAAALAQPGFIESLTSVAAPGATLEIVTAIHPAADAVELQRLGIPWTGPASMADAWHAQGLGVRLEQLDADHPYQTTWWRRIRQREGRTAAKMTVTLP